MWSLSVDSTFQALDIMLLLLMNKRNKSHLDYIRLSQSPRTPPELSLCTVLLQSSGELSQSVIVGEYQDPIYISGRRISMIFAFNSKYYLWSITIIPCSNILRAGQSNTCIPQISMNLGSNLLLYIHPYEYQPILVHNSLTFTFVPTSVTDYGHLE